MPLNLSGVLGARPTRFTGSTRKTDNMPRLGKGLFEGLTPRKQKRKKTMIDEATVRRIKDAANVADVIGDFRELRKRGADRWECLCPFHDDRHLGSFAVSRRHNRYCCYSCGAKGDSIDFLMQAEGMTYPDALRWLGRKYGIEVEGSERMAHVKPCKPGKPVPELPMLVLPLSYLTYTLHTADDTLCRWIRQLPWNTEQARRVDVMLRNYAVGHSRQGHTIWWQIDEEGQVRTGHMMMYKADGHRDKETRGANNWVHNMLRRPGRHIIYDDDKMQYETTLFGMHLTRLCPKATVNIVESEKTALLCAIYWGGMRRNLWLASGGICNINRRKLKPLIDAGRYINLIPDKDGAERWKAAAANIGYERLEVYTGYTDEYWLPEDGAKADLGDIIVRRLTTATAARTPRPLMKSRERRTLEAMEARNPAVGVLMKRLKLKLIEQ